MRLELAERLVCPAGHARTPLVVIASRTVERDLIDGSAGCMHCHREARIVEGSLEFDTASDAIAADLATPDEDLVFRFTALLSLGEPGLPVLLAPSYRALAPIFAERFDTSVAVLGVAGASPRGVGHIRGAGARVPFADASFHAAALDASMPAEQRSDAIRCVRVGGRVLAPTAIAVPGGVRELARDARHWVGEVQAHTVVVPLRKA